MLFNAHGENIRQIGDRPSLIKRPKYLEVFCRLVLLCNFRKFIFCRFIKQIFYCSCRACEARNIKTVILMEKSRTVVPVHREVDTGMSEYAVIKYFLQSHLSAYYHIVLINCCFVAVDLPPFFSPYRSKKRGLGIQKHLHFHNEKYRCTFLCYLKKFIKLLYLYIIFRWKIIVRSCLITYPDLASTLAPPSRIHSGLMEFAPQYSNPIVRDSHPIP